LDLYYSGSGLVAGSREHDNELSGYIKDREFLDQLSDYWLLKKDSAPYRCYPGMVWVAV
jgi:hypothetical protein